MMTRKKTILLLLLFACLFACGEAEETIEPEVELVTEEPVVLEYGTVSGSITDAGTGNRIPGSTVTLLGESVETGVDGGYTFQGILYADDHTLVVTDPDYQTFNQPFSLNQERLIVDIALTPTKDAAEEIQDFLDNLSDLLETMNGEDLETIQNLFSETYVAADDPATLFGVASGVIPENYEDVMPAVEQLFMEYDALQFLFQDIEMDITHARKAAATLQLDINGEKDGDPDLRTLAARCLFEFRREGREWKIVYWQLFELDIRL